MATASIVGGEPVGSCGFPTVVSLGGCTGTLVHPRVISTAQHCNPRPGSVVTFGEEGGLHRVEIERCIGQDSEDAALCELSDDVPMPVTPVLFGCEVDKYMQVDQPVVLVGFGQTSFGGPSDGKRWGPQRITRVEPGRTIIGDPGDGVSPCPGDSGGPVFVETEDGSYRVFGTVLGGTTGIPCNSAVDMQRIDVVVPHFERETGIDVTPCFDGETGAWEPSEDCGGFNATAETGMGSWDDHCAANGASDWSAECGDAFGDPTGQGGNGAGGEGVGGTSAGGAGGQSSGGSAAGGNGQGGQAAGGAGSPNAGGQTSGGTPTPGTGGDSASNPEPQPGTGPTISPNPAATPTSGEGSLPAPGPAEMGPTTMGPATLDPTAAEDYGDASGGCHLKGTRSTPFGWLLALAAIFGLRACRKW